MSPSKGEVLIFRKAHPLSKSNVDEEAGNEAVGSFREKSQDTDTFQSPAHPQTATFAWKDVCYDIVIKAQTRRILSSVDGWVQPGKITALMVSDPNMFLNCADLKRELRELERRRCSMCLRIESQWALSQATWQSMDTHVERPFNEQRDMFNSRIFTLKRLLLGKLSDLAQFSDSRHQPLPKRSSSMWRR